MAELRPYRKRQDQRVIAVQLNLDTSGFDYEKWGGHQHCKAGDWVVSNGSSTYTVDQDSFARTYRHQRDGVYLKVGVVWAIEALSDGVVQTKEGSTHYCRGDYLVSNEPDGSDAYAISADKFLSMYEPLAGEEPPAPGLGE